MEDEVKSAVYMGIELIVSSAVIAAIVLAMTIGNKLINIKERENAAGTYIAQQAQFSTYMNDQGRISGSDVMDIILTYAKVYDFAVVDKSSGSVSKLLVMKSSDDLNNYTSAYLKSKLGSKAYNTQYNMQQILTSDGYTVLGIVFSTGGSCTETEITSLKNELSISQDITIR